MPDYLAGGVDVTALMIASQKGHLQIVQALLDKGADVNAKTKTGVTALSLAKQMTNLMIAPQKGDSQILQAHLDKGADVVNAKTRDEVTQLLIKAGAKE